MIERLDPSLSPEQAREEIKKRCESLATSITLKEGGMPPIKWSRGQGWAWNFVENYVRGDEDDIDKHGLGYSGGVMVHEASHVVRSRPGVYPQDLWEEPGFAVGTNWVEDNRIEYQPELIVNKGQDWVEAHLDVDAAPGGGLDYKQGSSQGTVGEAVKQVGYIPKHMMLGAAMRQYFYHREYTGDIQTEQDVDDFIKDLESVDPEVAAAFEQIYPYIEDFYTTIPGMFADEEEVMARAEESAQIYIDEIWPVYKELVDTAYEEHSIRKFIDELIEGGQFEGVGDGGIVIIIDMDSLPEDVQQEIQDAIEQGVGGMPMPMPAGQPGQEGQQGQETGQPSGEGSQAGQEGSGAEQGDQAGADAEMAEGTGAQGEQTQGEETRAGQSGESQSGQEGVDQAAGQASGEGEPADQRDDQETGEPATSGVYDQLSDEAKDAIKEAHDQLAPAEKEQLADETKAEMGDLEDSVSEQMQGHTDQEGVARPTQLGEAQQTQGEQDSDSQPDSESSEDQDGGDSSQTQTDTMPQPSESQISPPQQDQQEQPPKPAESQQVRDEHKQRMDDYLQEQKRKRQQKEAAVVNTEYDNVAKVPENDRAIRNLKSKWGPVLRPDSEPQTNYDWSGANMDEEAAIMDETGDWEGPIFYDLEHPEQRNYRFTILVDLSGSMAPHIEEMFAMIVMSEVLAHLGIQFEVIGFTRYDNGDIIRIYKSYDETSQFGEKIDTETKQRLGMMRWDGQGGTPTSHALLHAFSRIVQTSKHDQEQMKDFLVVFTDGRPTDVYFENMTQEDSAATMLDAIDIEAQKRGLDLTTLGLGIGSQAGFVSNLFGLLPKGLRAQVASALRKHRKKQGGDTDIKVDDISNTFDNALELAEVLPLIFDFILENAQELKSSR